jgi:hypothetical protein
MATPSDLPTSLAIPASTDTSRNVPSPLFLKRRFVIPLKFRGWQYSR